MRERFDTAKVTFRVTQASRSLLLVPFDRLRDFLLVFCDNHVKMTNCPGVTRIVLESQICIPRPGQTQSGAIKCPGIVSTALIMIKELLHLARVARDMPNLMPGAFISLFVKLWE